MGAKTSALGKRLLALTGAIALGATVLFGGAAAANAEPEPTPDTGNINFSEPSSISIHKRSQPTGTQTAAPGTEIATPPGEPLSGIEFTVQRTTVDLTNPAVWPTLESLSPADVTVTGAPETKETIDGLAYFDGLTPGVYLVTEGDDNGDNGIHTKSEPFLVVIPMNVDNAWLYNIHVYPKNALDSTHTKTLDEGVDATSYGAGDPVVWNTSSVIQVPAAGEITSVTVTDTIDSRLGFADPAVSNVQYNGVALADGDWTGTPSGQTLVFSLTESGLATVNDNPGLELTFDINTVVTADEIQIGDGVIVNGSTLTVNNQETESTPSTTNWGNVNIFKHDATATTTGLEGAKFQVFASEDDAANRTNPISVNNETVFETDENGALVIGPLNAGADDSRDYWVVEIEAPAGYSADHTPKKVTVVAGENAAVTYEFANTKIDGPDLPLTGATGTWMFILGGVALVAVATGIALRSRRANA